MQIFFFNLIKAEEEKVEARVHLRSTDKPSKGRRRWQRGSSGSCIHHSGSLMLAADSRAVYIPDFSGSYGLTRRRWLRPGKPEWRQCSYCVGDSAADAGAVLRWLCRHCVLRCLCDGSRSRLRAGWIVHSVVCCCNMQGSGQPEFASGLLRRLGRNLIDCFLRSFKPCTWKQG